MKHIKKIAAATALACMSSSAFAAIVAPGDPGGSEALLSIVNNTTNDSISIDLGKNISELMVGDVFELSQTAQNFIAAAGGLGEISYGVIAGEAVNFSTANFLTSSTNDLTVKDVANATRGTWLNSVNGLVGNLNASDPSGPEVNNTYGPFSDVIGSPNYRAGGHDVWQTGDPQLTNLALGTEQQQLYQYSLVGFAGFVQAEQILAPVQLTDSNLSIVPIPAAVWLMGSALMGLMGVGRRSTIARGLAALKSRMTVRVVDLM